LRAVEVQAKPEQCGKQGSFIKAWKRQVKKPQKNREIDSSGYCWELINCR
jgi:hypothetical protein